MKTPVIADTSALDAYFSASGFSTNYFIVAEKGVLVVFLMNGPGDYNGVTDKIHRWLREVRWLD